MSSTETNRISRGDEGSRISDVEELTGMGYGGLGELGISFSILC
jgi:hypothetical protein